jgi:hypothetical protein
MTQASIIQLAIKARVAMENSELRKEKKLWLAADTESPTRVAGGLSLIYQKKWAQGMMDWLENSSHPSSDLVYPTPESGKPISIA